MAIEILVSNDDHVVATWNNLLMRIGRGAADVEQMDSIHRQLERMAAGSPHGVGMLMWFFEGTPLPDSAGRTRATEMFRDMGPKMVGFAAVIEGSGFLASATRSVLTGFALVARSRFPLKIFGEEPEAIEWLAPLLGKGVDAASMKKAVQEAVALLPVAAQ